MQRLFILLTLLGLQLNAQDWTWMRGSTSVSVAGSYGTMGVSSPTNDPGSRHGSVTWVDKSGNLWLFGGEGYSNSLTLCWLNDLWKYNKATNQWTWVRGSNGPNAQGVYGTQGLASSNNDPGAREFAVSWTDTSGKFWLFGGEGFDATNTFGNLGDLWRYDPATNQWTWMKGFNTVDQNGAYGSIGIPTATNLPGCRHGSGYWIDVNNKIWLFGGDGFPASGTTGQLNDLWKYDPLTNQWTWMKGTDQTLQPGTYGTVSVTATGNLPGGRSFPACWYAKTGDLYMLGGAGHGTVALGAHLSDLWKYNPSSNNWTWMGGHYGGNFNGTYGVMGQASASVKPGGRRSAASWVDPLGKLWLFGGFGYAGSGSHGYLNDLFSYEPSTGLWAWVRGDSTMNLNGTYGTMGVPASTNKPGGRSYNTWWTGTGSQMWLIGGLGRGDTSAVLDNLNDLWKFDAPCNPGLITVAGGTLCSGASGSLSVVPPDASAITWYASATSTSAIGTGSTFVTSPLNAPGSATTFTYYAQAATCSLSPRSAVTLTVHPLPQLVVSGPTVACQGDLLNLVASGAQNYTWSTGYYTPALTITVNVPGYTVVVLARDTNGCENSVTKSISAFSLPVVTASAPAQACEGSAVSFTAGGAQSYTWHTGAITPVLTLTATAPSFTASVTGSDSNGCQNSATTTITVNPAPVVTANASPSVMLPGATTTISAGGASTYSWNSGQTVPSFTFSAPTLTVKTFTVWGTDSKGCTSSATITVKVELESGLEDLYGGIGMRIYPNPSSGSLFVEAGTVRDAEFVVTDLLGKTIARQKLPDPGVALRLELPAGLYVITVISKDGASAASKLIVR